MKNIIATFMMIVGLASCAVAPVNAQEAVPCYGPDVIAEMNNAARILEGVPMTTVTKELVTEVDGINIAVYYDAISNVFMLTTFDFNWCFEGSGFIPLTPEQAKQAFNLEVPN